MFREKLIQRDLKHIWHPCSQMKDFEEYPPLIVQSANGCFLHTDQGILIDGISSWWCKSLGHQHPEVIAAIQRQMHQFEHVIAANTTHPLLVELGEKLAEISGKQHVSFASDGSCAVEIAMKMALQAQQIRENVHKTKFISLRNAYHGETLGALSVSDLGKYKDPYSSALFRSYFLQNIPYVNDIKDPLWSDCSAIWPEVEKELSQFTETGCAILVEPIIQGAAGMLIYSADFLKRLHNWCKTNHVYLICDEIMTGIGRSGRWLASEYAAIQPDFICLSKGLTAGTLPFSCTLIDHKIFELFYESNDIKKSFLHSHTYSGNPLAVSAALATLNYIDKENILQNSVDIGHYMLQCMDEIAGETLLLKNVRGLGALVAADMVDCNQLDIGKKLSQRAIENGALLRPIGNTLYWLPPLNSTKEIIGKLAEITLHSIKGAYAKS